VCAPKRQDARASTHTGAWASRISAGRWTSGRGAFLLAAALAVGACGSRAAPLPPAPATASAAPAWHTVTVADIAATLPKGPVAVGFDVDDTALFTSPGYFYLERNTDGPGGANRYGDHPFDNPEAIADLNREYDKFALPKRATAELIALHQRRGDDIWFITARPVPPTEIVSGLLQRYYGINRMHPVIFLDGKPKGPKIRELVLAVYYGEGDGDITAAQSAGARPIRFLRSPMSTDPRPVHPGAYGEEVLEGSDR
jgi:acid phosphatase (class B)